MKSMPKPAVGTCRVVRLSLSTWNELFDQLKPKERYLTKVGKDDVGFVIISMADGTPSWMVLTPKKK